MQRRILSARPNHPGDQDGVVVTISEGRARSFRIRFVEVCKQPGKTGGCLSFPPRIDEDDWHALTTQSGDRQLLIRSTRMPAAGVEEGMAPGKHPLRVEEHFGCEP